jgi:hypothetical protein
VDTAKQFLPCCARNSFFPFSKAQASLAFSMGKVLLKEIALQRGPGFFPSLHSGKGLGWALQRKPSAMLVHSAAFTFLRKLERVRFAPKVQVKLDCFLSSFGSGLGVGFTKKAIRLAVHGAAFSFLRKLEQARFAAKEKTISFC